MATSTSVGRPADSKNRIVEEFRTRIVTGDLNPGSRFPTRSEIERQFGAGPTTVQNALESLRHEGFIRVEGRKGTFVADNPPHLSRYAVVFAQKPSSEESGQFLTAILRELELVAAQIPEYQLLPYHEVDGHEDSEDYVRLCREVMTHRIAGLIFTNYPHQLVNTPLLDEPNIPRVAIMQVQNIPIPAISPDATSFWVKALDHLQELGHRRIALIDNYGGTTCSEPFSRLLKARNMETRPYWHQLVDIGRADSARNCAHLIMMCRDMPDALVICDDNLVESATMGLIDAGDNVPVNFSVVAHANFPYPTPCLVPAKRIGFDVRQVLQVCIDNIHAQRRGESVPIVTDIAACFEDELACSHTQ